MIFTIRSCTFGYCCITTQDSIICGVELAPSSEQALFQAMERFEDIKTVKSLNDGKVFYLDHLIENIVEIINGKDINQFPIIYNNLHFLQGSIFQYKIWRALRDIPVGQTISYKELANKINSKAIRAIGTACGKNPLAILVPCHRVIKSNNDIGQYRWGIDIKRKLLNRELIVKNNTGI